MSRDVALLEGSDRYQTGPAKPKSSIISANPHESRGSLDRVTRFDSRRLPHGWECGFLGALTTRTLFCGDLFTQAGATNPPLTEGDVLGPSEAMRKMMDYYAHGKDTRRHLEKLAAFDPRVLACMHGRAFAGDGRAQLLELAAALEA